MSYPFPVHYFVPGMAMFSTWEKAFTPAECDQIIAMCQLVAHESGMHAGLVGNDNNKPEKRITDVAWLEPTHENDWVHHRISAMVGRRNSDAYQLDLSTFDAFQYSVYDADKGGHYGWHSDIIMEPRNPALHRKLSAVLMLSDPEEYEGGELQIVGGGDILRPDTVKLKKGDLVFFYSFLPHQVTPVTKGLRQTLVTWVMGEKFR